MQIRTLTVEATAANDSNRVKEGKRTYLHIDDVVELLFDLAADADTDTRNHINETALRVAALKEK